MSKAFVKEGDGDGDELDDEIEQARAPVGRQYITPDGFERMQEELDRLWKVERPKVTREVEAAAALGDRSENAEYIYGKRRLREIDRRLRFLKKRLESVTVVGAPPDDQDKIFFGATVTVEDEEGTRTVYRLVGADEIDLTKRWVSLDSPIGAALLGKRVGDYVTVKRPRGDVEVQVVEVAY